MRAETGRTRIAEEVQTMKRCTWSSNQSKSRVLMAACNLQHGEAQQLVAESRSIHVRRCPRLSGLQRKAPRVRVCEAAADDCGAAFWRSSAGTHEERDPTETAKDP